MVERVGMFSSNEQLEDISTSSLKYILLPYYASLVHTALGTHIQDPGTQANALRHALVYLERFTSTCTQYGIPGAALGSATDEVQRPTNPQAKRIAKIAAFKRCGVMGDE